MHLPKALFFLLAGLPFANAMSICVRGGTSDGEFNSPMPIQPHQVEDAKKQFLKSGAFAAVEGDIVAYNGGKGTVDDNCKVTPYTSKATSYGDPHITTWSGKSFDFHGGCDLVLLQNPDFSNGLGMTIHIRTQIKTWWSFIEAAVVKLGENTLEVHGGTQIKRRFNGETTSQELQTEEASLGDYAVKFVRINDHQSRTRIDLGNGDAIGIETFKDFVRVNIKVDTSEGFIGSAGLLGSYPAGEKVARDGSTILEDSIEFGQEWRVRRGEATLFHDMEFKEVPLMCAMPEDQEAMKKEGRRRLGEAAISEEDAALACARVQVEDQAACIFDVLATNDQDMAGSY